MEHQFTLRSRTLQGQATTREVYVGAGGENISPHLAWTGAPSGTKSFAITIHDKDAPTGSGWWHWLIFNIPSDVLELAEGAGDPESEAAPVGAVQSINDYGEYGYGGPCPPVGHGIHEYKITIRALDIANLEITKDTNPAVVGFNLGAHTLAMSSLIVYYER